MATTRLPICVALAILAGCAPPVRPPDAPIPTALATSTGAVPTSSVPAPQVGATQRWIEVDLTAQIVRLREGDNILAEYLASTGVAALPETTTYPGVYQVQEMIKGPIENVPGVFVSDILIYDQAAGAGIHSMPMDNAGNVLDGTLGKPSTAGCIRVGESRFVFDFARLGTTVWIH